MRLLKFSTLQAFLMLSFFSLAESLPERSLLFSGESVYLSFMDEFKIHIDDQVTDGCLANPKAVKDNAELGLRRNNFKIITGERITNNFFISVFGYKVLEDYCIIHASAYINYTLFVPVPYSQNVEDVKSTVIDAKHDVMSILISGSKTVMQSRVEEFATQSANTLFLNISRAQDTIFTSFPELKSNWEAKKKEL